MYICVCINREERTNLGKIEEISEYVQYRLIVISIELKLSKVAI